ncbi:ABC transporter permease [Sanguibacter sp. 25GB23B1]|uniref:ABC transporter permease n=1 Tax=unclassified Sanguibacter TaxID=2645534 RepID=UPI0032AFFD9E
MWSFAKSSARAHRASMAGSFLIVLLASALLAATGVLMDSGLRTGFSGEQAGGAAMMLATVAGSFGGTTILIVVLMVSSTISAALRQRRREFALLRAVGATGAQIRTMVTGEVLLVFAVAGPLGAVPGLFAARLLEPLLASSGIVPTGYELTITPAPVVATLLLLVPTGLLAARLAAREAVRTSPTAAVQQSTAEPSTLGRGRTITAVWLAGAGLAVALVPFFSPGLMGTAAGASSAFLLITAAALAGPVLVAWVSEHALRLSSPRGWASGHLAMANARGFSRRLTSAIVPLALLLALGTVQSGVNRTAVEASGMQLEAGLKADLVVDASTVTPDEVTKIGSLPGVAEVVSTGVTSADVKVDADDEDIPALDALSWEPTALRVLPSGMTTDVVDPQVTAGSLTDLDDVSTIAVGGDATFGTFKGLGDTVELRFPDGTLSLATIVAVYDRGLGFGDFLVGESTAAAHDAAVTPDAVFLQAEAGSTGDVRDALAAMGVESRSVAAYVQDARSAGESQQTLSAVLLLALLAFIGLAAANTLAMLTSQRGGEFTLLKRTGATGRQLTAMVAVESVFVVLVAWVIGTAAVVPALVGASVGLLGTPVPTVDWAMYGGLAAAVAVIAVLTILPVALRKGAGTARA